MPTNKQKICILIPVFEDFECLPLLEEKIQQHLSPVTDYNILVIDDGSFKGLDKKLGIEKKKSIKILTLSQNVGHQRSITIGLCYIRENCDYDQILIMDGDGEDNPADAVKLISESEKHSDPTIFFARRDTRSEPISFKFGYLLYRVLFRILTGKNIKFGNFSLVPNELLDRLTGIQEIWNHYAASIVFAKIPYIEVPSSRSGRIHGRPKMNFTSLILHGLSAISIFNQTVFLRLLIGSFMFLFIILAILLTNNVTSLHVDITYLIMSVCISLFLVLINFTAIIFSLKSRNKAPCIPRQFWEYFIKKEDQ
mgnify:FL=1